MQDAISRGEAPRGQRRRSASENGPPRAGKVAGKKKSKSVAGQAPPLPLGNGGGQRKDRRVQLLRARGAAETAVFFSSHIFYRTGICMASGAGGVSSRTSEGDSGGRNCPNIVLFIISKSLRHPELPKLNL